MSSVSMVYRRVPETTARGGMTHNKGVFSLFGFLLRPDSLNPKPQTVNPKSQTPNPKPFAFLDSPRGARGADGGRGSRAYRLRFGWIINGGHIGIMEKKMETTV